MKKDLLRNKIKPKKPIKILKLLAIYTVRFYQYAISPALTPSCRFYPSCSSYAIMLLKFDNIFLACIKICLRIFKCNPLFHGGFAPPYIYLTQRTFDNMVKHFNIIKQNSLATPCTQKPQKTTYFFINSNSRLLKLKKFYIISIHL